MLFLAPITGKHEIGTGTFTVSIGIDATSVGNLAASLGKYAIAIGKIAVSIGAVEVSDGIIAVIVGTIATSVGAYTVADGIIAESNGTYAATDSTVTQNPGNILTLPCKDKIVFCPCFTPMRMTKILAPLCIFAAFICCTAPANPPMVLVPTNHPPAPNIAQYDTTTNTIHVLVALCDNMYQGIVPVPAAIGNGQNPATNLYWGCAYGIKTYFGKSAQWQLLKRYAIDSMVMERLVFKHRQTGWYLVADAYNGQHIKQCTVDFLKSCAGMSKDTLRVNGKTIGYYGNARLLAYIGHDGLMDFSLTENFANADKKTRDAIMLACISKKYFAPHLQKTGANPLLWSTGLMAPEAYILHDALESYLRKEPAAIVSNSAAKAYSRYQHCSLAAASKLLVTGY